MDRDVVSHAQNGIISVATLVRLCDLAQRTTMVSLAWVRVGVRSKMWKSKNFQKQPTCQVGSNYRLHTATTCFFSNEIKLILKAGKPKRLVGLKIHHDGFNSIFRVVECDSFQ